MFTHKAVHLPVEGGAAGVALGARARGGAGGAALPLLAQQAIGVFIPPALAAQAVRAPRAAKTPLPAHAELLHQPVGAGIGGIAVRIQQAQPQLPKADADEAAEQLAAIALPPAVIPQDEAELAGGLLDADIASADERLRFLFHDGQLDVAAGPLAQGGYRHFDKGMGLFRGVRPPRQVVEVLRVARIGVYGRFIPRQKGTQDEAGRFIADHSSPSIESRWMLRPMRR